MSDNDTAADTYVPPSTAAEAIERLRADGDADPEGTARLNHPKLFEAETAEPAPPEDMRTTPLDWDELAPFSIAGTIELAGDVLEGAEQAYIAHTEPHYHTEWVGWGVLALVSDEQAAEVIRYAIERRPAPEVLFNKMRELGHITGPWDELTPVDRASFELAARILPAVADVAEVMNAEMVRRNPPVSPATAAQLVDIEDTILERVDGIDDIDPQMAAVREKADEEAAKREAEKKPTKAKKRSIADKTDD